MILVLYVSSKNAFLEICIPSWGKVISSAKYIWAPFALDGKYSTPFVGLSKW